MTLKDLHDALAEYHGSKGTADFREDWQTVVDLAKDKIRDVVLYREYSGDNFTNKKLSLENLLLELKEQAENCTYTRGLRLDIRVHQKFTKEAFKKPLAEVIRIQELFGRFISLLTEEVRDEHFSPRTETTTRWVPKKPSGT